MADRTRFGFEHLLGNTAVQRNLFPRLTGSIRRADPDGGSAVPYYPTLTGTSLSMQYTKEIIGVVTVFTVSASFISNSMQAAIALINGLDAAHLEASDLDGFLSIRNKNAGKTHFVSVTTGSAASIMGFEVAPYPGFKSVAGEIANTPVGRTQLNPVGTVAAGRDEGLDSSLLNRMVVGFADYLHRIVREQDRELLGYGQVYISGANLFNLGGFTAIKFPTPIVGMRIPLLAIPEGGSNPDAEKLAQLFKVMDLFGAESILSNKTLIKITDVLWGNPSTVTSKNVSQAFSTYLPLPTPVAFSAFGNNPSGPVTKVPKTGPHTIASIKGNVVKVAGSPAFLSGITQPGDYVVINNSTVTAPASHNGEFIIDEVLDNNTLVLRAKTKFDPPANSASESPQLLNRSSTGTAGDLTVLVGSFLEGAGLIFVTSVPFGLSAELNPKLLRYARGVRLKEATVAQMGRHPHASIDTIFDTLVSVAGAALVGASPTPALPSSTVQGQIADLANGWYRKSTANVLTGQSTFNNTNSFAFPQKMQGQLFATSPALVTDVGPQVTAENKKLLWVSTVYNDDTSNALTKARLYASPKGFELSFNAFFNVDRWETDTSNASSWLVRTEQRGLGIYYRSNPDLSLPPLNGRPIWRDVGETDQSRLPVVFAKFVCTLGTPALLIGLSITIETSAGIDPGDTPIYQGPKTHTFSAVPGPLVDAQSVIDNINQNAAFTAIDGVSGIGLIATLNGAGEPVISATNKWGVLTSMRVSASSSPGALSTLGLVANQTDDGAEYGWDGFSGISNLLSKDVTASDWAGPNWLSPKNQAKAWGAIRNVGRVSSASTLIAGPWAVSGYTLFIRAYHATAAPVPINVTLTFTGINPLTSAAVTAQINAANAAFTGDPIATDFGGNVILGGGWLFIVQDAASDILGLRTARYSASSGVVVNGAGPDYSSTGRLKFIYPNPGFSFGPNGSHGYMGIVSVMKVGSIYTFVLDIDNATEFRIRAYSGSTPLDMRDLDMPAVQLSYVIYGHEGLIQS